MNDEQIQEMAMAIGRNILLCQKEVLTLDEAAQYTGMKKSTLYKLTSTRAIPHYKPTGKVCFFKRVELEAWLTANRVATSADIEDRAQAYCMRNKTI